MTESDVEAAALAQFEGVGWRIAHGPDIAPNTLAAEKRVKLIAQDIVEHFEKRLGAMDGKAMVVCMSRRTRVELLQKLLKGETRTRRRKNVVQARSFAEMLEQTIRNYQSRAPRMKPERVCLTHNGRDRRNPPRRAI